MLNKLLMLALFAMLLSACEDKTESAAIKSPEKNVSQSESEAGRKPDSDKKTDAPSDETTVVDEEDEEQTKVNHAPLSSDYIIAASQLAGLNMPAAEALLGKPEREETIQFRYAGTNDFVPAVTKHYMNGQAAVTFVEKTAARIVFTPSGPIPFDDELSKALEQAGIPGDAEPKEETGTASVFENVGGVYSVTAFKKAELVDYLYIILEEKYK
ncbi:hypothetical protein ACFQPF_16620 [Fictibacillus iocasae]|uniref:Lipoprotein n=1 Tax=Fictibacillus iocasae TaxID=2715437 RepID=A0ABW2NTX9_9BACL